MRVRGTYWGAICSLAFVLSVAPAGAGGQLAALQGQFDRETNSIHKAKLLEKLGDLQFEEARRAGKAGDDAAAGLILEKYRDNVRSAFDALRKQHPDTEKHSNGYRRLEIHVRKGIREVQEALLAAPSGFKPPLEIVRQDLIAIDDELLKLLFPLHPAKAQASPPPAEKQL